MCIRDRSVSVYICHCFYIICFPVCQSLCASVTVFILCFAVCQSLCTSVIVFISAVFLSVSLLMLDLIQFAMFVQDQVTLYCCEDYCKFISLSYLYRIHPHCTAVRTTVSSSSLLPAQHCAWNRRRRKPQRWLASRFIRTTDPSKREGQPRRELWKGGLAVTGSENALLLCCSPAVSKPCSLVAHGQQVSPVFLLLTGSE